MGVIDTIERGFGSVNATVFRQVNRARDWWQLPTPVALLNLRAHRDDLPTMPISGSVGSWKEPS